MNALFNAIANLCASASQGTRPYLTQVALAISSTLLAIYGGDINGWFKDLVKGYPFVLRVLAFVLLVAFGYGALGLAMAHFLAVLLGMLANVILAPVICLVFLLIGLLAEEKRHI